MEIIEYPKALYRNGEYLAVADRDEEDAAAADGWTDWHSDQANMQDAADAPQLNRDDLKARAKELGIEFPKSVKTEALAALVADKEAA